MNTSEESQAITARFFLVIDNLINKRKIRGLKTFTDKYGLNYWNVWTVKNEPDKHFLRPEWLAILVRDYNVSATYLLTGVGLMFIDSRYTPKGSIKTPWKY